MPVCSNYAKNYASIIYNGLEETDLKTLDHLRQVFSELLENFLQHFRNNASRPSRVTSVPCQVVKNGGPGRPSVNIPPEVLEEVRGLTPTLLGHS